MSRHVPDVSVVVPCYLATPAHAALLHETLDTVAQQRGVDYEAIVVDDGSPLDVASVTMRHPRTIRVWRPNSGSAHARNTGIAASRGRNFVFLDADDHLLPGALESGLAHLEAHPGVGFVVGPREEMTYEGGPVPWGVAAPPPTDDLYRTLLAFDWYIIPPSSVMFRREVVEAVHGFRDPWGADDLDFYLRVARRFAGLCHGGPAVTRYRRYSTSSSRDGARMLRSVRAVYARQWPYVEGDPPREAAFHTGLAALERIFRDCLVENVRDRTRARQWRGAVSAGSLLVREEPRRCAAYALRVLRSAVRRGRTGEPQPV
jgi:glycosyltransferase involved in cell wall biosynthesis